MVEKLTVQQLVQENRELKQRLSEAERSSSPSGPSIASAPVTFTVPSALSNVHPLRLATSSPAVKFSATPDSNIGQLSIEAGGTSRYYGALAHVHILPDEEEYAGQEEPLPSSADGTHVASGPPAVFPFNAHDAAWSAKVLSDARRSLPAYDMIDRWLSLYWQASSWRFECVSREYLEPIVLQVYSDTSDHPETQASQLALVFGALAFGCLFDGSLPPHSQEARKFHSLSTSCLSAGNFLRNSSVNNLCGLKFCTVSLDADLHRSATLHLYCCFLLNDGAPRTDEVS